MTKQKKSFLERISSGNEDVSFNPETAQKPKTAKDFFESDPAYYAGSMGPAFAAGENSGEGTEGQLTVDVYHTEKDIVIRAIIGGANVKDVDITINNDMVAIKGVRNIPEEISPENYYYRECFWGAFSRSIILPQEIDSEKAEASIKNGILTIRLPKADKVKSKKVQVIEN